MIDGEVRFTVALVRSDGAAGHLGNDGSRDGRVALAITSPDFRRLAVLVLELSSGETKPEAAVFAHDRVHGPHARRVLAKPAGSAGDRYGAQAGALQRLERAISLGG